MYIGLLCRPALEDVQPHCTLPQELDERTEVTNHADHVIRSDADQVALINRKSVCRWFNQGVEGGHANCRGDCIQGGRPGGDLLRRAAGHGSRPLEHGAAFLGIILKGEGKSARTVV